jgi:hypothetical protein
MLSWNGRILEKPEIFASNLIQFKLYFLLWFNDAANQNSNYNQEFYTNFDNFWCRPDQMAFPTLCLTNFLPSYISCN